jgi:hypothetical protein
MQLGSWDFGFLASSHGHSSQRTFTFGCFDISMFYLRNCLFSSFGTWGFHVKSFAWLN